MLIFDNDDSKISEECYFAGGMVRPFSIHSAIFAAIDIAQSAIAQITNQGFVRKCPAMKFTLFCLALTTSGKQLDCEHYSSYIKY